MPSKKDKDFDRDLIPTEFVDDSAEVEELQRLLAKKESSAVRPPEAANSPPNSDANAPIVVGFPPSDPARAAEGIESARPTQVDALIPSIEEESTPAYEPTDEDLREYTYKEVIIDRNGVPRQAGADSQEGEFIRKFRDKAEKSLFLFCKGVLGRTFLTKRLHKPVCEFLQKVPPFRKLVLMPRAHAKTAIVSGGLPLHIIIQPAATNIYFPGLEGSECRIMLAGENMRMAKKNLRVLEEIHTGNKLFRALWPQRCWSEPRRQSKTWNQDALIFPRENEWPDPTIWALGVDGAVTGSRPNIMIKDDLVSIEAANSDVVMESAIEWHKASRALLDTYTLESGLQSLEFIIGTRWSVYDLYSYIQDNDPSVEVIDEAYHRIISDGQILWPEKHSKESIEQLHKEYGAMFYLLFLNSVADPELVDFDLSMIRDFRIEGGKVIFDEDERDGRLRERFEKFSDGPAPPQITRGQRLTAGLMRDMVGRKEFFRARYG